MTEANQPEQRLKQLAELAAGRGLTIYGGETGIDGVRITYVEEDQLIEAMTDLAKVTAERDALRAELEEWKAEALDAYARELGASSVPLEAWMKRMEKLGAVNAEKVRAEAALTQDGPGL